MSSTLRTSPLPVFLGQQMVAPAADGACLGGWIPAVDDRQVLPLPDRFILKLSAKLTPRCIVRGLGSLGSRDALDTKIFDANAVVPDHQVGGQLVQEILPLVCGLALDQRYGALGLRSAVALELPPAQHPLSPAQLSFPLTEELRRSDMSSVAQYGERLQPKVNTDNLSRVADRQRSVRHLELRHQCHM